MYFSGFFSRRVKLLVLQENQGDFLLELDDAVSRWMFSDLDLLQEV